MTEAPHVQSLDAADESRELEQARVDLIGLGGIDFAGALLGSGGHSVRLNGRVYEVVAARLQRRDPLDLYHAALLVRLPEGSFVIEQAPVRDRNGTERGVVAEGAVGSRRAGRFRLFRYEVRCWLGGVIPDVDEAVQSPQRLTDDPDVARRLLDLVHDVPTAVWGRDELAAGEMWNSNSLIAWLIERCGLPAGSIDVPAGGRAPGWRAGVLVARPGRCGPVMFGGGSSARSSLRRAGPARAHSGRAPLGSRSGASA